MFEVIHKHNGGFVFFATVSIKGDHFVYLSAYGQSASALLEKYLEGQRADNEELFAEWDKSVEEASSQVGFTATLEVEDGYIYINTYQNGIGISVEAGATHKLQASRSRSIGPRTPMLSSELSEGDNESADEED